MPKRNARVLVTGTLAIDHIGRYPGAFSTLPRHQGINLSVQLAGIERRFGGCAMNIAYTLRRLGHDPAPFVFVGQDYDADYAAHLAAVGLDTSGVQRTEAPYSSHAFVFTDREGNQFTAFFGGPARLADCAGDLARFVDRGGFVHAILAPDVPANMIAAAEVATARGIPFLADPGQNTTDFAPEDALRLVRLSDALIVNEFEHETLRGMVGGALGRLRTLVVTRGERGVFWRSRGEGDGEERAVAAAVVDPTGAGDAFRGGFLHALLQGASMRPAVRAGAVTAAMALEAVGTQVHHCDDFAARYRAAWGEDFNPPCAPRRRAAGAAACVG